MNIGLQEGCKGSERSTMSRISLEAFLLQRGNLEAICVVRLGFCQAVSP